MSLDNNGQVDAIFIDLAKAFDQDNRSVLLHTYGIFDNLVQLFYYISAIEFNI